MSLEIWDDDMAEAMEQAEGQQELEEGVLMENIGEMQQELGGLMESFKDFFEGDDISGDPEKDMENWHHQTEQNSCAVACQEFVAEQLLDREFSEQELIQLATERGWYDPATGTPVADVGNILEGLGLEVERQNGVTLAELAEMLDNGEKVIVGVNNMVLANPSMANLPGMSANHAVQVIGIDGTDPDNIQIILNDPGVENGQGIRHDLSTFMTAWSTSGNYTVSADKE